MNSLLQGHIPDNRPTPSYRRGLLRQPLFVIIDQCVKRNASKLFSNAYAHRTWHRVLVLNPEHPSAQRLTKFPLPFRHSISLEKGKGFLVRFQALVTACRWCKNFCAFFLCGFPKSPPLHFFFLSHRRCAAAREGLTGLSGGKTASSSPVKNANCFLRPISIAVFRNSPPGYPAPPHVLRKYKQDSTPYGSLDTGTGIWVHVVVLEATVLAGGVPVGGVVVGGVVVALLAVLAVMVVVLVPLVLVVVAVVAVASAVVAVLE